MHFYRGPFLYLSIALISGILLQLNTEVNVNYLALLCIPVLLVLSEVIPNINLYSYLLIFMIVGYCVTPSNDSQFEYNNKLMLIGEVIEAHNNSEDWNRLIIDVENTYDKHIQAVNYKLLAYHKGNSLFKGDVIGFKPKIQKIENKGNPGEFDSKQYWNSKGVQGICFLTDEDLLILDKNESSWIETIVETLQNYWNGILSEVLNGEALEISRAMILGDKSQLNPDLKSSFGNAGAMHVLAVSGLHVGIILYLIQIFLGFFKRVLNKNRVIVVSIVIIWIYAGITGFSPSVMRSAFMFSVLSIGQLSSKQTSSLNSLFFAAFCMLVWNPLLLLDIGFQLSYIAVLGILLFYKPLFSLFFIPNKWIRYLWQGTVVGIAAQIATFPIALYYFHQFPNYFFVSNLGIMLFAGIILGFGLLIFIFGKIPFLNISLGLGLKYLVLSMIFFVVLVADLPFSVAYGFDLTFWHVCALYALLAGAHLIQKLGQRKLIWMPFAGILIIMLLIQSDRYYNLNKQELVIFNSNNPLITIKSNDKVICLHSSESLSNQERNVVRSYANLTGAKIAFHQIRNSEFTSYINGKKIFIVDEKDRFEIKIGNHAIELITNYKGSSSKSLMVTMPYLVNRADHSLINGAFKISI